MLVGWIIRVLILALFVLVMRLLMSGLRGTQAGRVGQPSAGPAGRRRTPASVPLVKDPVCGVYIEPSRAVSMRTGSTVHYFCSETCRQTFSQNA